MRAVILSILVVLLLSVAAPMPAAEAAADPVLRLPFAVSSPQIRGDLETLMLNLINRDRQRTGLSALHLSPGLREAARGHGRDLFKNAYLSHTSRSGSTPMERALQAGVRASTFGENLAYASTVTEAHQRLMASPGHRGNIVSPVYRWIGIGVLDGGSRGVIVVQNFSD